MDKLTSACASAKTTDEMPLPPLGALLGITPPVSAPADEAEAGLGVYVHFPWCIRKCPYCDFLSVPSALQDTPHRAYADAVLRELEARQNEVGAGPLRSVFFGGGTPSLWNT